MNKQVKNYLDITRENYSISKDVISYYAEKFLNNLDVEFIIIWSSISKNEILKINKRYYIIWDTHYWSYLSLYYDYLLSLSESIGKDDIFEKNIIQADCVWADLFRVVINRISSINLKLSLYLSKYYLSYGKVNFSDHKKTEIDEKIFTISKLYTILHEVAHIDKFTSDLEYMFKIQFNFFKETYNYDYIEKELIANGVPKDLVKLRILELENEKTESVEELKADIIALNLLYVNFFKPFELANPNDDVIEIFRNAFAFGKSFNSKINSLYFSILINFYRSVENDLYEVERLTKEYIDFALRDYTISLFDFIIFRLNFEEYEIDNIQFRNKTIIDDKTSEFLGLRIGFHIENLFSTSLQKKYDFFNNGDETLKEFLDFLLYYHNFEIENLVNYQ